MLKFEKVIKGPWGTEIKLGIPILGTLLLLLAFIRWERPTMGVLYETIALLVSNQWAVVFFGTTVMSLALLLPYWKSELREGKLSIILSTSLVAGLMLISLALLSPLMKSVPRWAGPSIGLVQVGDDSGLRELISTAVDQLRDRLGEPVELRHISTSREQLGAVLKNVARYQHDIVILDYDEPLKIGGGKIGNLVNPRTLYILARPGNPRKVLPPNVIFLSPPIVEEVYALAALIDAPTQPLQVIRSDTPRAIFATELLQHVMTTRGLSIKPERNQATLRDLVNLAPGEKAVWIGWRPHRLTDDSTVNRPSVITANATGELRVQSITTLPYVSRTNLRAATWNENQILAIGAIFKAHFIEAKRPLDTLASIDAAVQHLASEHLATVSRGLRLVPRYTKCGELR